MNEQDRQYVIDLVASTNSALRIALEAGEIRSNPSNRGLRFEVPSDTLDDAAYDLFRPTAYLLSCVNRACGVDVGYITLKKVITPPSGLCFHATTASSVLGIYASGLLIGRNVRMATARAGIYLDSNQYIHASSLKDWAAEYWYYDRLGHDQDGAVLKIDLNAAGCELLADPRSEDGIIHATRIDPQHIVQVTSLPSLAKMKSHLQCNGWFCEENAVTMTVNGRWNGFLTSKSGCTLPGAWRKIYLDAMGSTLP